MGEPITLKQMKYLQNVLEMPTFPDEETAALNKKLITHITKARKIAALEGDPEEDAAYAGVTVEQAADIIDRLKPHLLGVVNPEEVCLLCGRGTRMNNSRNTRTISNGYCGACSRYVVEALEEHGDFQHPIKYGTTKVSPIVRHSGNCYICGEVPSQHADHVISKSEGGSDTFENLGGSCAHCNLSKGDDPLPITPERQERLAAQQARIQGRLDVILTNPTNFWLGFHADDVEYAVEALAEDFEGYLEDVTSEDIVDYLGLDDGSTPAVAVQAVTDEVMRRLANLTGTETQAE